jgi:hypothetical protein
MKHVIIIETVDREERIPDSERFTQALTSMVEELTEVFEGECFVQTRFYVESATVAVHEMFNLPPWNPNGPHD